MDRGLRSEPSFCRAGICIASVLCDGAIATCPNISRARVQGNIKTHDFKTVWEQQDRPFRDRSWMKTGPCVRCPQGGRCQGNSLHLWDPESKQTSRCLYRRVCPLNPPGS
jgi:radical SAM protein with 4Fe4S-binding SPASM domain